jgi:Ser/Thr protein kinase RdoA (MazF antagonist)
MTAADDGVPGPAYAGWDTERQVEALRAVALEAADAFALDVSAMALVLHGFNTTFRVDTADGEPVAIRVNTNSSTTPAHLVAQQGWVHAIACETDIRVPDALATPEGSTFVSVPAPDAGREFLVVANTWLDGPDVEECDVEQARALGATMAILHEHARTWTVPPGGDLERFDEPLFGDRNLLEGSPRLSAEGRMVVDESFRRTRKGFARASAGADPIILHADLHGGNLKWHQGRLAVFDFDDSGLGVPALDLAVATFYLRDRDPALEAALREGYAGVAPLPDAPGEVFEGLVASRQLLLANSLLASSTAQWQESAGAYLDTTVGRLRHWLDTGRFTLNPPRTPQR